MYFTSNCNYTSVFPKFWIQISRRSIRWKEMQLPFWRAGKGLGTCFLSIRWPCPFWRRWNIHRRAVKRNKFTVGCHPWIRSRSGSWAFWCAQSNYVSLLYGIRWKHATSFWRHQRHSISLWYSSWLLMIMLSFCVVWFLPHPRYSLGSSCLYYF